MLAAGMKSFLDELRSYVGLDDGDCARLIALHPRLVPALPAIAESFYTAIWAHPRAAAVLTGPDQVERLRMSLIEWMGSGLLGPYDDAFYEKRSRIGRRHVQIGLPQEYMFTAMNVVRTAYHARVSELYTGEVGDGVHQSVNRLLDIELAIMVRHYQLDSEDKLLARERRLQAERISAMQTMTAGLAHEVRSPLSEAKLQLELLARRLGKEDGDPRLLEPCEVAQSKIVRLTELLNEFLAFARPGELQVQDHNVAEIVRHVCDVERVTAEQNGATLALVVAPDALTARVDFSKLHQVVRNLVRNAVEAVTAGGHVTVELTSTHDAFVVAVRDTGPGIALELQSRIYEPFYSTKAGGTGLGMSIVQSLLSMHGGTIALDSSSQGTSFDVTFPRCA